ncbi:MAG: ABC transporter substrate-binding protein [Pseudothermotoga sp.]
MKLAALLFVLALALIIVLSQVNLNKIFVVVLEDGEANFFQGVETFLKEHQLRYEIVRVRIDTEKPKLEAELRKYQNSYAVGPRISSQAHDLIPFLEEYRIFAIAPQVTSYLVVGKSNYLMSLSVTDEQQGKQIAELLKRFRHDRVLLVCDKFNPVYSQSLEESLRKSLSAETFRSVHISSADELVDEDFAHYDVIVLAVDGRLAGMIAQLARTRGFSGTLVGSDYAFDRDLIPSGKSAVEGMIVCRLFNYPVLIEKGFDDIDVAGAYDAMMLIAELLQNKISPQNAAKYLRGRRFAGVTGEFSIGFDLSSERDLTFAVVKNGSFEFER